MYFTGQSSALPPVFTLAAFPSHADFSASPDLTEDPGIEVPQRIHNPAGRNETSAETTTITKIEATVYSESVTNAWNTTHTLPTSSPAAPSQHVNVSVAMTAQPGTTSPPVVPDSPSSTPTVQSTTPPQHISTSEGTASPTRDPLTTFSSQPTQDTNSTAHTSTQPQSESLATVTTQSTATTGRPLTSAPGQGPIGPTHQEVPSELNVGDEDFKGSRYHSNSPLDPLLAGLLSVFIVTTAIVFVILFLKFRQRTNHPEFHRLQDLPMDDLMEDTPLSRYTY
ncbi:mucin-2-like [Scomber scombrus]|uniref:mucin-2-like n=1 Tax=Scomber scombrus TaxID=13677 RepID=UPI002DDC49E6|nr:mucin-2-like [Scomber scombrus]